MVFWTEGTVFPYFGPRQPCCRGCGPREPCSRILDQGNRVAVNYVPPRRDRLGPYFGSDFFCPGRRFGLFLELVQYGLFLFILLKITRRCLPEHQAGKDQEYPAEDELELVQGDQFGQFRPDESARDHGKTDSYSQFPADKLDL